MQISRFGKQYIIAAIFLSLTTLLFMGVYYAFIKSPATCFDNRQNQDERGVDCGGTCVAVCKEKVEAEKFQIKELAFVQGGSNRYDVLAKIYNPNDEAGASSFRYTLELKDAAGSVLVTEEGEGFILPQETKTIIKLNLETTLQPATVNMKITDIVWEKFSGYLEKPNVNIYQKRYSQLSTGTGFGEAFGLLSNESQYDFRSIAVKVILRDATGKLLALNETEMRSVSSGEQRDFRLVWPLPFPGTVERVDMEVDADVYHSENFMQQYLPQGKFQDVGPAAF